MGSPRGIEDTTRVAKRKITGAPIRITDAGQQGKGARTVGLAPEV